MRPNVEMENIPSSLTEASRSPSYAESQARPFPTPSLHWTFKPDEVFSKSKDGITLAIRSALVTPTSLACPTAHNTLWAARISSGVKALLVLSHCSSKHAVQSTTPSTSLRQHADVPLIVRPCRETAGTTSSGTGSSTVVCTGVAAGLGTEPPRSRSLKRTKRDVSIVSSSGIDRQTATGSTEKVHTRFLAIPV